MNPTVTVCPCGKNGYATAGDAVSVLRRLRAQRRHRTESEHYRCPSSGLWHLTSAGRNRYRQRDRS